MFIHAIKSISTYCPNMCTKNLPFMKKCFSNFTSKSPKLLSHVLSLSSFTRSTTKKLTHLYCTFSTSKTRSFHLFSFHFTHSMKKISKKKSLPACSAHSVSQSRSVNMNGSFVSNVSVGSNLTSFDDRIASISQLYNLFYDNADPRIRDFFLMGRPHWIVLIYLGYVLIITRILPDFMRNRKPYDFQKVSLYIDAVLLLIACYFLVITTYSWFVLYNWRCQVIDPTNSWTARMAVEFCWQYLMTRFIYTLHSVPFVLSKRKSSLANYLIVHHAVFPVMAWSLINFYPGGHITFGGWINCITHVGLFGIKFVILYYPEVKRYRAQFHYWIHVSRWK